MFRVDMDSKSHRVEKWKQDGLQASRLENGHV